MIKIVLHVVPIPITKDVAISNTKWRVDNSSLFNSLYVLFSIKVWFIVYNMAKLYNRYLWLPLLEDHISTKMLKLSRFFWLLVYNARVKDNVFLSRQQNVLLEIFRSSVHPFIQHNVTFDIAINTNHSYLSCYIINVILSYNPIVNLVQDQELRGQASMGADPLKSEWSANKSIDGCTNQSYLSNCCSITNWNTRTIWWKVWLQRPFNVAYLELYFRADSRFILFDFGETFEANLE